MNVCILQMLYFHRIDVSEGCDVNKTTASKVYDICYYWYFLNYSFKFQPNVYTIVMSMNLSDIAMLNIKGSDYCCIIILISKTEATTLIQNADLTTKKKRIL